MQERAKHIDVAKGLTITLVVVFHSELYLVLPSIIEPMALFRMPLFFMLSGVFFSWNLKSSDFLIKKFNTVLKPYALVSFALLGVTALRSPESLSRQLIGIFYGNGDTIRCTPMWFLTHLFIVNVFAYIIFKNTNLYRIRKSTGTAIAACMLLLGTILIDLF